MTEPDDISFYGYEEPYQQRERLPFISILLGLLIVASMTVSSFAVWNNITRGLGIILAYAYVIRSLRARLRPNLEIFLYFAWVIWSLTGSLNAKVYLPWFWRVWLRVFQLWILIAIVSGFTESRRRLSFNFVAFLFGASIVAAYSILAGTYLQFGTEGGQRLEGLNVGANGLGWMMVLATTCLAYFFMTSKRLFKLLSLIAMGGAGIVTIMTGSRKAILALGLFYPLWIWFCYRKDLFRRPAVLLAVILALAVGGYVFVSSVAGSDVGERFAASWRALKGEAASGEGGTVRMELYKEAGKFILDNPVIGIGLDNFRFQSRSGLMEHSEYTAVACGSGLPGFVLYFSIFVVLWRRAGKIVKYSDNQDEVRIAGLIRALLVIVMAMNFGRWNYDEKYVWIVFAACIGYTSMVWARLRTQVAAGVPSDAVEGITGAQDAYAT